VVLTMLHGLLEKTATVLKAVVENPTKAPTRMMASSGVEYGFLKFLLDAEMVQIIGKGHWTAYKAYRKGPLILEELYYVGEAVSRGLT